MLFLKSIPRTKTTFAVGVAVLLWLLMHMPGLMYGSGKVPLNVGYVGDEQVSVTSVLHVLQDKSLLAFRNEEMQYYGPLFVILDMPGVLGDFAWRYVTGVIDSPESYKQFMIWNWGGIVKGIRLTAMLSMLAGLYAVYRLAATTTLNPSGVRWIPYLVTLLLGSNYYYFEYSNFATHWAYVLPLLIVQLYSLVRIGETQGVEKKYWVVQVVSAVVSFGVSYMGMIFLVMWVPLVWRMWQEKDRAFFTKFVYCMSTIAIGYGLIVWWHPYAFIRYLSFLGIGEALHNQGDAQNPFALGQTSLGYYSVLIILNNLGLALALLVLAVRLWRVHIVRSPVVWMLLLPGIVNFCMFGFSAHHEGRYMLPTLVVLIVLCGYLVSKYFAHPSVRSRRTTLVIGTLLVWYVLFSVVHIGRWMYVFSQGPIEQEGIRTTLDLQKTGAPVLVINSYIMGYPHTADSYRAFALHRKFGDVPLYTAFYEHPLPSDHILLDARYEFLTEYQKHPRMILDYPHVILHFRPRPTDWNQFSYFDEDITRNWYYRDLSPRYLVIK